MGIIAFILPLTVVLYLRSEVASAWCTITPTPKPTALDAQPSNAPPPQHPSSYTPENASEELLWMLHPTLSRMKNSLTQKQQDEIRLLEDQFRYESNRVYNPSCGIWQRNYMRKHAERMKPENIRAALELYQKEGKVPPDHQYVGHYCPALRDCGGVADHLFGAFSIFAYCVLHDKTFFIDWPEDIWFPEKINWNASSTIIPVISEYANRQKPAEAFWLTQDFLNWNPDRLDHMLDIKGTPRTTKPDEVQHDDELKQKIDTQPFVRLLMNRGSVFRQSTLR